MKSVYLPAPISSVGKLIVGCKSLKRPMVTKFPMVTYIYIWVGSVTYPIYESQKGARYERENCQHMHDM